MVFLTIQCGHENNSVQIPVFRGDMSDPLVERDVKKAVQETLTFFAKFL